MSVPPLLAHVLETGQCLGTSRSDGTITHREPVQLEYSFEMCGIWCPVCRTVTYSDEMRHAVRPLHRPGADPGHQAKRGPRPEERVKP